MKSHEHVEMVRKWRRDIEGSITLAEQPTAPAAGVALFRKFIESLSSEVDALKATLDAAKERFK